MGIIHKKQKKVIIEKGTIEDKEGRKYKADFVGDNNDFVDISLENEVKKVDESIKDLLKQNKNEIHDICFINDYAYLLVGCNEGLLYVYKRVINNKSNLKFEEVTHFKPHKESIIQILKLKSGHILTLSSDSSSKILEIEIESNDVLYANENKCEEIQLLLEENESSNNSAIELQSEDLIISQGYFINFFQKNTNGMVVSESLRTCSTSLSGKEYHLTKKIFTNSDNIFFTEIDYKTVAASQISNNSLQFYNVEDYSLVQSINNKIEFSNMKNCMCLINKETLAIGGKNGTIYLVNTLKKQLFSTTHFENCEHISCIRSINDDLIIMGCQYWTINFDVIIYRINNNKFEEIKKVQKTHKGLINDIKLITMDISQNKNPLTEKFNVITLGLDYKVKLLLSKDK
jgi:hypothetical protein